MIPKSFKSCGKTFTDFTNSATYKSKKTLDMWLKYAKCMINGYSIRKSTEIVGINIATSFFWRHKILDCIRAFFGIGSVEGVIEADEVFFAESFKGTKPSKMPRKSRKRGKQVKKRGKHKEGIYHIQHINAVHSKLKKWMNRFNGVATKYISNYMYWFKWLELFENDKEAVKAKNFMVQCNVAHAYTKTVDFKERETVFVSIYIIFKLML